MTSRLLVSIVEAVIERLIELLELHVNIFMQETQLVHEVRLSSDRARLEERFVVQDADVTAGERELALSQEEGEARRRELVERRVVVHVRDVTPTHVMQSKRNNEHRNTGSRQNADGEGGGGGGELDGKQRLETHADRAREE